MQASLEIAQVFMGEVAELAARGLVCEKIISDRRGAMVTLLSGGDKRYALKFSTGDDQAAYDQQAAISREAEILAALGDAADNLLVASGEQDNTAWLLTSWAGATTAATIAKQYRAISDEQVRAQKLAGLTAVLCAKAGQAHAQGYLHGDLQPAHFIMPSEQQTVLIDWALAQKITGDDFQYKGSFIHFAAPEVAAQMLEKRAKVDYDLAAEVYSMGAVIYFLVTGETAVDYGADDHLAIPLEDKLKAVAASNFRSFTICGALAPVMQQALSPNRAARYPSMHALQADLAKAI